MQFTGKAIVVTGAASGIGRATAEAFAKAGGHVILADLSVEQGERAAQELRAAGLKADFVQLDVASDESIAAFAKKAFALGEVHVLANVAGYGKGQPFIENTTDFWDKVVDVNLMGVVHGIAAFLPHMLAQGEGHIVNTASLAGLQANIGFSPYVASKYGVVGISEGLAVELKDRGVGVSVICPGFVRTRIPTSARNRPGRYGAATKPSPGSRGAAILAHVAERNEAGIDPDFVAGRAMEAMRDDELYVFTNPDMRDEVYERLDAIRAALDRAD